MADAPKIAVNDLRLAADHASKLAAQFAGVAKMGEVLGQIASIEQANNEAQARLKTTRDAEAKAVAEFEATKKKIAADHADALASASSDIGVQRNKAEDILREARENAKALIAAWEEKAALVRDQEMARVAGVKDQAKKATEDLQAIKDEVAKVSHDLTELQIEHTERKTALERLRDEHMRFLAKIGAR